MFGNYLEAAIIVFILAGIGVAIWKTGGANPVGTGGLDRRVSRMDGELKRVATRVGELGQRVEEIDQRSAKKEDIERLEEKLARQDDKIDKVLASLSLLNQSGAAREVQIAAVSRQVDRLYDHIVRRGMEK